MGDADAELIGLLDDEYARAILAATAREPMTASELAEVCDASPPTVYRRLDALADADLIAERTEPDPDGHHRGVYAARLDAVHVALHEEGFDVAVDRREPETVADRFTRLYEGLR